MPSTIENSIIHTPLTPILTNVFESLVQMYVNQDETQITGTQFGCMLGNCTVDGLVVRLHKW